MVKNNLKCFKSFGGHAEIKTMPNFSFKISKNIAFLHIQTHGGAKDSLKRIKIIFRKINR